MRSIGIILLILASAISASAEIATIPLNLSPRGIADWTIKGAWIGSGTGALPAIGPEGSRYTDLSTPSAPIDYRSNGSSWVAISSSGGGGGGVTAHDLLTNLGFDQSGHTGFGSATDTANNAAAIATNAARIATAEADLATHKATSTDPHGPKLIQSEEVQIGTGTPDAMIYWISTGTLMIASYVAILEEIATPTGDLATFTFWGDKNTGKVRIYDGSTWRSLW